MSEEMGYKYWVAFEVRCLETDKRISQHHSIFLDKAIDKETDLTAIESTFKQDFDSRDEYNEFDVKLTCWPKYLGRMEKPLTPTKSESKPKQQTPKLSLAIDNTNSTVLH